MSAGAKLTVIRPSFSVGGLMPLFFKAESTLSFASLTALSANPTILKEWRPLARSASTSIISASMPFNSAEKSLATLPINFLIVFLFFFFAFNAKFRFRFNF